MNPAAEGEIQASDDRAVAVEAELMPHETSKVTTERSRRLGATVPASTKSAASRAHQASTGISSAPSSRLF